MPGRYVTLNTPFTPITYDQYMKPLQEAAAAHNELEQAYGTLDAQAAMMDNYASQQSDPKAYARYQNYANDLRQHADNLMRYGLTPSSRRELYAMSSRYNSEIQPIENAFKARAALADEQRKAGPDMLYERYAKDMSLDEFLDNPMADYGRSYSGAQLTKMVATASENLKKRIMENPRMWRNILGDQYYETYMQYGFSPDEVQAVINGDTNANPILASLVKEALVSSGINDWADNETMARAWQYAAQGLWSAVGDTKYETLENWAAKIRARSSGSDGSDDINGIYPPLNEVPIYSPEQQAEEAEMIKTVNKYFTLKPKDEYGFDNGSTYILNQQGIDALRSSYNNYKNYEKTKENIDSIQAQAKGAAGYGTESLYKDLNRFYNKSDIYRYIDNILTDDIDIDNISDEELSRIVGNAWGDYLNNFETDPLSDASVRNEYVQSLDENYGKAFAEQLKAAQGNIELYESYFDKENNEFKPGARKKQKIDPSDIEKVVDIRMSPYGNSAMVMDKNKNVKRVQLNPYINPSEYQQIVQNINMATHFKELLQKGIDEDGNPLTESSRKEINEKWHNHLHKANLHLMNMAVQNKTKTQEYTPFGF